MNLKKGTKVRADILPTEYRSYGSRNVKIIKEEIATVVNRENEEYYYIKYKSGLHITRHIGLIHIVRSEKLSLI